MALRDEVRAQREKAKEKGVFALLQWIFEYYRVPALLTAGGIVLAVFLLAQLFGKKETAFGAVFLNTAISGTAEESAVRELLAERITEAAGLDPKKQQAEIDLSLFLTPGGNTSPYDMADQTSIAARMSAGELDVIVADVWNYDELLVDVAVSDLREVLSPEELAAFEGQIYYTDLTDLVEEQQKRQDPDYFGETKPVQEARDAEREAAFVLPDPSSMAEPVPAGIVVTDAPFLRKYGVYSDTVCIFGFVNGSSRPERAKAFLQILLENA